MTRLAHLWHRLRVRPIYPGRMHHHWLEDHLEQTRRGR